MSAVVKEFRCAAHGDFEGTEPVCPRGCEGTVSRIFLTPAAFRSNRTTRMDARIEGLAKAHNLTDISNRGGRAAIRENPRAVAERAQFSEMIRDRYGDTGWGAVPKGGNLNVETGKIAGSGSGALGSLSQYHAAGDNVLGEVKPALTPRPVDKHVVREEHRVSSAGEIVKTT